MQVFGMPISVAGLFIITAFVIPVITEFILHSKWWKKKSDYYFSFNEPSEEEKE